jgi:hypothetical protein
MSSNGTQRSAGLDCAPAQGAGCVSDQPAVDARHVERVAAHRQAPRGLAGFELLRWKQSSEPNTNDRNKLHAAPFFFGILDVRNSHLEANGAGDVLPAGVHVAGLREPHHR